MPSGEVPIICPSCQHRSSLPIAAVKRNNYYCSRCFQKVPLDGVRLHSNDFGMRLPAARPKKSSRRAHR